MFRRFYAWFKLWIWMEQNITHKPLSACHTLNMFVILLDILVALCIRTLSYSLFCYCHVFVIWIQLERVFFPLLHIGKIVFIFICYFESVAWNYLYSPIVGAGDECDKLGKNRKTSPAATKRRAKAKDDRKLKG